MFSHVTLFDDWRTRKKYLMDCNKNMKKIFQLGTCKLRLLSFEENEYENNQL